MHSYKRQRGLGAIAWLCLIVVVVFFGLCAFKMVPAYNENQLVKAGLRSLAKDVDGVQHMTRGEIHRKMQTFYSLNNVRGEAAKHLEVEQRRDKTLVKVNYDVRVPLFANISVVMTFNNVLDSSKPGACCRAPSE